jgi:hypothetical protein
MAAQLITAWCAPISFAMLALDVKGGGGVTASDTIFTIGHSTRSLAEFVALLRQVDVTLLVDVRSIPRSRMTPQFNTDTLPAALAADGHRLPASGRARRTTSSSQERAALA